MLKHILFGVLEEIATEYDTEKMVTKIPSYCFISRWVSKLQMAVCDTLQI